MKRGPMLSLLAVVPVLAMCACGGSVSLDVGSTSDPAAEDAVVPRPPCSPLGPEVRVIAALGDLEAGYLAPDGAELWFAGGRAGAQQIYRVAVAGGQTPTLVVTEGYAGGPIAVTGSRLFHLEGRRPDGSDHRDPYHFGISEARAVVARSVASGRLLERLGESSSIAHQITALHADRGGVFWSDYRQDTYAIGLSRYDLTTRTTTALTRSDYNWNTFAVDASSVFYFRGYESSTGRNTRLEGLLFGDGSPASPRVVHVAPEERDRVREVIAVDETEVFWKETSIGTGDLSVHAIDKSGSGAPRVVARGLAVERGVHPHVWQSPTAEALYFISSEDPAALLRVNKRDGVVSTFGAGVGRLVVRVAIDECNVYWSVLDPPAIMGRSR